jgi:subtilisin family serine protease
MNRFKHTFITLVASACVIVAPAFAQEEIESVSAADNESPSLWFVELAGAPLASGGKKADLKKARDSFAAAAKAAGAEYSRRFEFETLWNGVSVSVSPANISRIARLPEVVNVWPVDTYSIPDPIGDNAPELAYALPMTGANTAQAAGFTGMGMKIGIIDTGVDVDHPDFGGTGVPGTTAFPSSKIVAGYDFVGDLYDANPANPTYNPVPSPDPNPDDCGGHGSHVAGIAAGNGVIKGVAPDAKIGAYRVFGCNGSTNSDIMVAAMERAYLDGMHVVNMSIGAAFQTWPQYPTAVAGDRLVARGVVVVCSIGNSGANGQFSASAPGVGNDVIGTASFDNTNLSQKAFMVSPGGLLVGFGPATAAPVPPNSGSLPIGKTGTPASIDDGCPPWDPTFGPGGPPATGGTNTYYAGGAWLAPGSMAGKAVLIRRGTCGFWHKAYNAQQAGAAAVILYNNVAGTISPTVAPPVTLNNFPGNPTINIPTVAITAAAGATIDALVPGGATLTWGNQTVVSTVATGGRISSFSSYGLNAELTVKPDIGAPGGNIWSTIPIEQGSYGNNSGTSMASPHMAGMAALLRQAKPGLSASAVRDVLQNSAEPKLWSGNPGLGFLDFVHRQGAGMGRIDRAIAATTTVTPGKLSLGETEGGSVTQKLTFWNSAGAPVTYDLTHAAALASGPVNNTVSAFNAPSTVAFSSASVMVPAGGSASVDVTVTPNAGLVASGYFGGYVVATPMGGGEALRVPYAGTKGDYQALTVLVPTASNFPRLGVDLGGGSFGLVPVNTPWTYDMVGANIPFVLVHLEHPSRELRLEIFEAATGAPIHPVFYQAFVESYLPRNSTATGFFALAWDGTRQHNNGKGNDFVKMVPNGDYILKVKVLKALGDRSNPAHWETWTSAVVTIARP